MATTRTETNVIASSKFAMPRNPLGAVLRIALLAACVFSCGCHSVLELAKRTNHYEPEHYDLRPEECEELALYRQWADEAWSFAGECDVVSADYYDGFMAGFVDHVFAGGDGNPPAVPPRKYWRIASRASGLQTLKEWTDGFRRGAQVAIEGGYRDRVISPLASRLQFPDKLDEYRNQVRTRRNRGEIFQSPAMSDEYQDDEFTVDGSGTRMEVQPIEVDGLDEPMTLVDPDESESDGASASELDADASEDEVPDGVSLRVPGRRDEDVDPFEDIEDEVDGIDQSDETLELPSAPELQLLDDDLSSAPRRRSFGDYRNIVEASQGNGPSVAYASAVAAAQAARNGQKLDWQAPLTGSSQGIGTGFSEAARENARNHATGLARENAQTGNRLPRPIHGSRNSARIRARLRTTEEVSRGLQLRFRDLDEVESKGPDDGEVWGSRFQRMD